MSFYIILLRVLAAVMAALFLSLANPVFANDYIGQVKVSKGTVHIERDGQRLPVSEGTKVKQSDKVVTAADGSVGITFSDNTLISAGPDSVIVIDRYAFNSTTHDGAFDASVKKGTLSVVSGKIAKQSPEAMKVKTPAAILGVRGTEFLVRVSGPEK